MWGEIERWELGEGPEGEEAPHLAQESSNSFYRGILSDYGGWRAGREHE